jgi:hypothetical protein
MTTELQKAQERLDNATHMRDQCQTALIALPLDAPAEKYADLRAAVMQYDRLIAEATVRHAKEKLRAVIRHPTAEYFDMDLKDAQEDLADAQNRLSTLIHDTARSATSYEMHAFGTRGFP